MKRVFIAMMVALVGGCGSTPAYKGCMFGDRHGCIALRGSDVLFTIVTDGVISGGGVSNVILRGPRYEGRILLSGDAEAIAFSGEGHKLRIGSQVYDPTDGNLFLVSVKGPSARVAQFDVSEAEKITSLLRSHDRVGSFF
ncbi:MAG: hypothetical protein ABIF19_11280 [Planctomycetota bacterium]